ncbi:MAG: twin-arginine translocase TatA/TatE family subunit [bacterium]|nr:twin-arginine translocase TatA/TatE family subunit [bacterium]
MFGSIGVPEILLILGIALLLFGARRLPEIGRGLGKGIREFKRATKQITDEIDSSEKNDG